MPLVQVRQSRDSHQHAFPHGLAGQMRDCQGGTVAARCQFDSAHPLVSRIVRPALLAHQVENLIPPEHRTPRACQQAEQNSRRENQLATVSV